MEREPKKEFLSENYISVDIESSGPIPGEYSMLSVGACVVGNSNNNFYAEIKPISEKFVPQALEISGFSLEELKISGKDPDEAMINFEDWLKATSAKKPVLVGHNASFDWQFINYYFLKYLDRNPFGINALDIKGFYMGKFDTLWSDTNKRKIDKRFKGSLPHTHNALDDAIEQAEIFLKIKNFEGHTLNR